MAASSSFWSTCQTTPRALTRASATLSRFSVVLAKARLPLSCGSIPRPASIMSAAAHLRTWTCCRFWWIGSRAAERRATSLSSNSRPRSRSRPTARCHYASGRHGRLTKRAMRKSRQALPAHVDAWLVAGDGEYDHGTERHPPKMAPVRPPCIGDYARSVDHGYGHNDPVPSHPRPHRRRGDQQDAAADPRHRAGLIDQPDQRFQPRGLDGGAGKQPGFAEHTVNQSDRDCGDARSLQEQIAHWNHLPYMTVWSLCARGWPM